MDMTHYWRTMEAELAAHKIGELLRAQRTPAVRSVDMRGEDRVPMVEIVFRDLIAPRAAIDLGKTLMRAIDRTLLLHALHPHSVVFVVRSNFAQQAHETFDVGRLDGHGIALETIEAAWFGQAANAT